MHPVIAKTFGGLSKPYYFRQFFFGVLIAAFAIYMTSRGPQGGSIWMVLLMCINVVLYPYSRFVYESITGFIIGNNVFLLNAILLLFAKCVTMIACFMFSIFIAPIGLAYLYHHHSKNS